MYLLGGRRYPMRMKFFKFFEDEALVSLEWKPPHGTWAVLDYNHTRSRRPDRVFVSTAGFPADDQSLTLQSYGSRHSDEIVCVCRADAP